MIKLINLRLELNTFRKIQILKTKGYSQNNEKITNKKQEKGTKRSLLKSVCESDSNQTLHYKVQIVLFLHVSTLSSS